MAQTPRSVVYMDPHLFRTSWGLCHLLSNHCYNWWTFVDPLGLPTLPGRPRKAKLKGTRRSPHKCPTGHPNITWLGWVPKGSNMVLLPSTCLEPSRFFQHHGATASPPLAVPAAALISTPLTRHVRVLRTRGRSTAGGRLRPGHSRCAGLRGPGSRDPRHSFND